MSDTITIYAVYLTAASGAQVAGTVVNRILWDGASDWTPPAGAAVIADPAGNYQIGDVYTPPTPGIGEQA